MHTRIPALALASALTLAAAPSHAVLLYTLGDNGTTLISFNSNDPLAVTTVGTLSTSLSGIDYRPSTNSLWGYNDVDASFYQINRFTAGLTKVATSDNPTNTELLGIDFNPVPDRLRIVTVTDQNLRANVDTGATLVDGTLVYAAGDVNEGVDPNIIEAAYTNSDTNPATGTTLYYIDISTDTLATTAAPNAGIMTTVGALGVDADIYTGFDIFTDGMGNNTAYAILGIAGTSLGLYTINLTTGAATFIGDLGADNAYGLAAIPEPGLLAMLGLGGLAGLATRRRRR